MSDTVYIYRCDDNGSLKEIRAKLCEKARNHTRIIRDFEDHYICRVSDTEGSFYNGILWLSESKPRKAATLMFEYLRSRMRDYQSMMNNITTKCDGLSKKYSLDRNVWGELLAEWYKPEGEK